MAVGSSLTFFRAKCYVSGRSRCNTGGCCLLSGASSTGSQSLGPAANLLASLRRGALLWVVAARTA